MINNKYLFLMGFCAFLGAADQLSAASPQPAAKPRQLNLETKPWKGDFDQMLEIRRIRVLVPYSRSLYFVDKGRERGVTADLMRDFEQYLNQKYAKQLGKRPLTVIMIVTTRDKLLPGLADGLGDIVAGYGFDPLMLAAQGYQESRLNQEARSHVGAIGVCSIHEIEPNIHGGTKYMDQLMTKYFPDAKFSEADKPLFAFASYNAGPGRISQLRREVAKRGLDPDKWFNNVELVVAEKVGMETTTYVRNIYKYYASYRLTMEAQAAARKVREGVQIRHA